ncbi:putative DD41D transposase [Trichonephila clavipes]|nr:putative DD41D transposase [Trichonephila clavipes]
MYYSIDMNFFYSKDNLAALHFKYDQEKRRFVEWAQNEIAVVPNFHKRILFSDEAHFWLNGYVNKQNCRIWSEANPQVYVETPLHPEKLTVWCALWAGGIIGPYIFKNDEGHNVTVNGDRYRAMITNFFIPELNNHDVQELWLLQDGATCHTEVISCHNRFIERHSLVYADKPQTLDHLEDNIRRVIAEIRPQMLEKVIENWTSRFDYIRASRGKKLTVWCALWAGGIIGPYFFKNDEGHNVTVNGDRYRAMITNFFFPELNNPDVQELWLQQDGATCHTARATIDLLKDTFGDRLISHFGPVNWSPRSCDLTPLDYFLRWYVKSVVYAEKPQTLDHLEDNIRRVIADIRPQMSEKVIENWTTSEQTVAILCQKSYLKCNATRLSFE